MPLGLGDAFVVVEFEREEHEERPYGESCGGEEVECEPGEDDGSVDGVGGEEEREDEEEPHLLDMVG